MVKSCFIIQFFFFTGFDKDSMRMTPFSMCLLFKMDHLYVSNLSWNSILPLIFNLFFNCLSLCLCPYLCLCLLFFQGCLAASTDPRVDLQAWLLSHSQGHRHDPQARLLPPKLTTCSTLVGYLVPFFFDDVFFAFVCPRLFHLSSFSFHFISISSFILSCSCSYLVPSM